MPFLTNKVLATNLVAAHRELLSVLKRGIDAITMDDHRRAIGIEQAAFRRQKEQ